MQWHRHHSIERQLSWDCLRHQGAEFPRQRLHAAVLQQVYQFAQRAVIESIRVRSIESR
jgi:hypothetical protein